VLWHNGATAGSTSYLGLLPELEAAVVVLSNAGRTVDALGVRPGLLKVRLTLACGDLILAGGRMFIMPKAFPEEFRRDVVAVVRKGEAAITQIAKDFGVSPAALHRWMRIADREDGVNRASCPRTPRSCGRPTSVSGSWNAIRVIASGEPVSQVARDLGMSRATLYRRIDALSVEN
jgi:transposase-like protein